MPRYILESQDDPKPVKIALSMEQYFGITLPTLRVNGISILHFLDDGRVALRDNISDKDSEFLDNCGMRMFEFKPDVATSRNAIDFVYTSKLSLLSPTNVEVNHE